MRQFILCTLPVLLWSYTFAQTPASTKLPNDQPRPAAGTKIIRSSSSDTLPRHLELPNAGYDHYKNEMPFYVISKTTSYDQTAVPEILVKRVSIVPEPHAGVVKKYFSDYLSGKFETVALSSLSQNLNLNHYKLIPFRINSLNQIEELLDYEVTWQVSGNNNVAARGAGSFKNTSVLSTGNWYKISTPQTGIYKINRSFLAKIGMDVNRIDPKNLRIYGNGGYMLAETNGDPRIDDLEENAIKVIGEEDGVFNTNDYILFYATGTDQWNRTASSSGLKFSVTKNLYSDSSYYFITTDLGAGKRVVNESPGGSANVNSNTYDYYNYHEQNVVNFPKSGRSFYGEYFDLTNTYQFTWDDGDFITGDSLTADVSLIANSTEPTFFSVIGNGQNFQVQTATVSGGIYSDYAAPGRTTATALNDNDALIAITVSKITAKHPGWLDKVTVNARRRLNLKAKQFNFRDTRSVGPGKVCNFALNIPLNAQVQIWDVTDNLNPVAVPFDATPSTANFVTTTDILKEFCVAPSNDFYSPAFAGKIANQNLHSITEGEYLIITHPLFVKEAERLGQFHKKTDNLSYVVATTENIYNEFSSGQQDIAAIRDFVRMIYSRNTGPGGRPVKYLLLMGDGSYNNMNRSLVNNSNFVPTYQSHNSLSSTSSIATDDFFGLMDPDEGSHAEDKGTIDIGIGRFTCRTVTEVTGILSKIEHYTSKQPGFVQTALNPQNCNSLSEGTMGDWRNWLLFLGDDEDRGEHMRQSNDLTSTVTGIDSSYNYDKIFLDAYQRFSTPGGGRYPDAATDFLRRMKKGALIFNYTGHGGEVGLTAERLIDLSIINSLDNINKLSLFITATCEFSRYDDPARTSAGELCLLNPKGGAIALFTTCRLAYSDPNFDLNKITLEMLFTRLANGKMPTLGEAIQRTKSDPRTQTLTSYQTNFHLLGDPALRLAYPQEKVITSFINKAAVSSGTIDTLGALSKVTVTGFVADRNGNKLSNFNGLVYPTVFDKEQTMTALMNSPKSATNYVENGTNVGPLVPFQFKQQKNILYHGKALATNGEFSFTFIVPKDVSAAIGRGKISYYATNGEIDAHGYFANVFVGGVSGNLLPDNDGPQVHLYLNDKSFINGGLTNDKPVLFADLVDSSGINTLGSGIGHDISVVLDENSSADAFASKPVVLNDYYEAGLNSYQKGTVRYPYSGLSEGEHRLSFKVWDIQNNSSTISTDFIVAKSADLALKHVLNYPNPFTTRTKFFFEHNQACNPLKVNIQVYTVSGKLVKTIQQTVICEGFRPEGIDWDGRDDFGDKLARGVYIYRLAILDVENKKAEKIEKLVILN